MSLEIETTVDGDLAAVLSLDRQIPFAAAAAATAVAIQAQHAAIDEIQNAFITRTPWYLPSNLYGVHYTPATVEKPTASVHTNAYWLVDHEQGALRTPSVEAFLAIPTEAIQPNRAELIPRDKRPKNIADAFVLNTRRGPKLFERIHGQLQVIYNLVKSVHIKKRSTIVEPTIRTVEQKFGPTFYTKLQEALRTAK